MHLDSSHRDERCTASEAKFAKVKAAFDLLVDPSSRRNFDISGLGWGSTSGGFPSGRKYASPDDIPFDLRHNPWGQPKTSSRASDSARYSHQRGPYPSAPWDWPHEEFYTSNFGSRTPNDADRPISSKAMLGGLSLFSLAFYSYNIFVSVPSSDPERINATSSSGLKVMEERHERASQALLEARSQAKDHAASRREYIQRHARLLELETGTATGHLPLASADRPGTGAIHSSRPSSP